MPVLFNNSTGGDSQQAFTVLRNSRDTIPIRPATNQVLFPQNTTKSKAQMLNFG